MSILILTSAFQEFTNFNQFNLIPLSFATYVGLKYIPLSSRIYLATTEGA